MKKTKDKYFETNMISGYQITEENIYIIVDGYDEKLNPVTITLNFSTIDGLRIAKDLDRISEEIKNLVKNKLM